MQLHARDLGGEGRPPLVILHGILGSSRNWQTAGRDLAARHHVFALDLRNHGLSPHAPAMGFAAMADDLREWLDWRGLRRVTLLGHSLGGKLAMLFASRQPERLERLIVADIAPKAYAWPRRREEFAALQSLDLGTLRSRGEAEARLEGAVPDWAMRKFFTTNLERSPDGAWRWQINLEAILAALAELEADPLAPDDRYAGPALFITGGKSPYVRPEDRPGILRHFPAARFAEIPGAGHNPHLDAREEFVAAALAG